jgi:hypothetical protein
MKPNFAAKKGAEPNKAEGDTSRTTGCKKLLCPPEDNVSGGGSIKRKRDGVRSPDQQ